MVTEQLRLSKQQIFWLHMLSRKPVSFTIEDDTAGPLVHQSQTWPQGPLSDQVGSAFEIKIKQSENCSLDCFSSFVTVN